jgi:hypothetical protein
MIAISIACGLVICLFQFDVGEANGELPRGRRGRRRLSEPI